MIREKINSELANRSWSVRRLADETGIRYASLTEYLSGKRELSSKNLEIVFKTLDIMQPKQYTEKEQISYEFGLEVRKAGEKMKAENMPVADTYGYVDLFVINDSKNGINLEYSLRHIANRLHHFSPEFYDKLKIWHEANGKFSIDKVKFTLGMVGGKLS
jgi:transcriptional regulator with XRE-family HTH domain